MKTISRSHGLLAASLIVFAGLASTACDDSGAAGTESGTPAAAGGTGGGATDPGGDPQSDQPSGETPPVDGPIVISTIPAAGAKAVAANAAIVVRFDRAMDPLSVIAAYSSASLPADAVNFTWNAGVDELTITPKSPLTYAKGGPEIDAQVYALEISAAAKDKAGRPLLQKHTLSFATLRRISQPLPMTTVMTGRALSNNTFSSASLGAGDMMTGDVESEARAVFTFLVSTLPESGVALESATLAVAVKSTSGTPDASLGALTAEQVFFSTGKDGFFAEPVAGTSTNLVLSFDGLTPTYRTADVTAMLADDLANRVARSDRTQYRMRYLNGTSPNGTNDLTTFDKADTKLTVVYVTE